MESKQTPMEIALNLTPALQPNYIQSVEDMQKDVNNDAAIRDFEQARSNIISIISIGSEAIAQLGELAHASQLPGHYEVLSKLIKDLSDTSEKLLKTHEQLERIVNKKTSKKLGDERSNNVNVFVSTSQIADALKELDKKEMKSLRQIITESMEDIGEGISPDQFKKDIKSGAKTNYDKDLHEHAQKNLTGDLSHIGTPEKRSIQRWTEADGYKAINGHFRGQNNPMGKALGESLEKAVSGHKLPNSVWAYRGVHGPHADNLRSLKSGDTFHNAGFASTTLDPKRATHFARGSDILAMHLPKGAAALYVSHPKLNGHTSEREMLLNHDTQFRYSHSETIPNVPTYHYSGAPTGETKSIRLHHVEVIPHSKGSIQIDR